MASRLVACNKLLQERQVAAGLPSHEVWGHCSETLRVGGCVDKTKDLLLLPNGWGATLLIRPGRHGGIDAMIRSYQERTSVWMNAVLRGDVHSIRVGANSNVQDCAVLHGQRNKYPVIVGDWVTIGHNATVHGCVVEDEVVIGLGARVLNNARIGTGCIIAAGAVVPENTVVPPRTLWAGVPAKMRRELGEKDRELILEYAKNYLDYVEIYLREAGV